MGIFWFLILFDRVELLNWSIGNENVMNWIGFNIPAWQKKRKKMNDTGRPEMAIVTATSKLIKSHFMEP